MNRIVREHYPVANLPEDLRPTGNLDARVTITIEEEHRPDKVMSLEEIFAARRPPYRTKEDIDQEIRRQRDEWNL
jgi:hypothetical protein